MSSDVKPGSRRFLASLVAGPLVAVTAALPAAAGTESLPGIEPVFTPSILEFSRGRRQETGLNLLNAQDVAAAIRSAGSFCSSVGDGYACDCLSDQIQAIADSLPEDPGYDQMRQVLTDTSAKLHAVTQASRDASRPRINASRAGNNPVSTTRPLNAVTPEAEAASIAQTAAILEEAADLLLRSTAASQEFAAQYQTVAAALDSTALLLRS